MAIASISTKLSESYRFHRSLGLRTADAIERARRDVRDNRARYGAKHDRVMYGPAFAAYGERNMRWLENVADGLRFAGYADELAGLRRTGWYLDDCCGETVRGAVYQLPGRTGEPVYLAGYADPWNDSAAAVSFDQTFSDAADAALAANGIAERMAEQERAYRAAASAGFEHADLEAEIADRRRALLDLLAERRKSRDRDCERFPAIRAAIRQQIATHLRRIAEARARQCELVEQFGHADAFRNAA